MPVPVLDLSYARFAAPDLQKMHTFLRDFGMEDAGASDTHLFMRGCGAEPFAHVTEIGEPGYRGYGVRLESEADVRWLADLDGVEVRKSGYPGGGILARLTDPDGFEVDVIAGGTMRQPDEDIKAPPWNVLGQSARLNEVKRVAQGPATVARLGHVVHLVTDLGRTWAWYDDRFRLKISDDVRDEAGEPFALFIRFDRGAQPSDHHAFNFGQFPGPNSRFHHAAFEVIDFDDLMSGNKFLQAQGYRHRWGIGRHFLGSQIFDYWSDPWGNIVEHWTDGDLFTTEEPVRIADQATALGVQWGQMAPADLI